MNIFFKKTFSVLQLALIVSVSLSAIQAAGEVHPTFNAAVQETTQGSVQAIAAQPDGKILVGGNFTVANNTARTGIARLNADGTVDPTFDPPDFYSNGFGSYTISTSSILAVAVQADGKILVGGNFIQGNNQPRTGTLRLNADGSLDSTFAALLPSGNALLLGKTALKFQDY